MYDRRAKDKTLTLAVSGKLWNASLVMVDIETKTLWSHLLGRGMRGELIDVELQPIPSIMTDWKSWRKSHPETTVVKMSRTTGAYDRGMMQGGEVSQIVIGMVHKAEARAWPFRELSKIKIVNESVFKSNVAGGIPIVVVYDEVRGTAVIHQRTVDRKALTFRLNDDGELQDTETESRWDLLTGFAKAGPLKGKKLPAVNGVISLQLPWHTFYPNSTFWNAGNAK